MKYSAQLAALHARFKAGETSSFDHARERETILASGLRALATRCGITLKEPLQIDSNGEFFVSVVSPHAGHPSACGHFGVEFAAAISHVPRRYGIQSTDVPAEPSNGWTRINHFDVEKLIVLHDV